ncbi:hypothetical protein DICPUDRAFT_37177, partial [Dictyostelium purpureum]
NINGKNNHHRKHKTKSLEMVPSSPASSIDSSEDQVYKSVKCNDGSECPALNTCCLISDGSYACCPTPNGVCCNNNHCCTQGFHCGSGGNICIPGSKGFRF